MVNDIFAGSSNSLTSPAEDCFQILPDDDAALPQATKAIYIGQGGDLTLVPLRGNAPVTFTNLASGSMLDVRARAVKATGTTALDLIGLI
ncbi:MAG: hypothetical protein ACK4Z7_05050 [Novosphingobium sp.]